MDFKKFFIVGAACLCCFSASRCNAHNWWIKRNVDDNGKPTTNTCKIAKGDNKEYIKAQMEAFPLEHAKTLTFEILSGVNKVKGPDLFKPPSGQKRIIRADIEIFGERKALIQIQLNGPRPSPTYGSVSIHSSVINYTKLVDLKNRPMSQDEIEQIKRERMEALNDQIKEALNRSLTEHAPQLLAYGDSDPCPVQDEGKKQDNSHGNGKCKKRGSSYKRFKKH